MIQYEYTVRVPPRVEREMDQDVGFFGIRKKTVKFERLAYQDDGEYIAWLNELGREGWEVIKIDSWRVFFKRRIEGAPYREAGHV